MAIAEWELLKPKISLISGVLAASAFSLGRAQAAPAEIAWVFLGMTLTVGAASGVNMILESDTDGRMVRTRGRPMPSGRLPRGKAWALSSVCAAAGLGLLFGVGMPAFVLAAMALVVYAFIYTPLKRRTPLAFLAGLAPGASPPLIGWVAATGHINGAGLLLFTFILLWQIPHVIAIYTYLRDDYGRAGIPLPNHGLGDPFANRLAIPFGALSLLICPWLARTPFGSGPAWILGLATLVLLYREIRGWAVGFSPAWARTFKRDTLIHLGALSGLLVWAAL